MLKGSKQPGTAVSGLLLCVTSVSDKTRRVIRKVNDVLIKGYAVCSEVRINA